MSVIDHRRINYFLKDIEEELEYLEGVIQKGPDDYLKSTDRTKGTRYSLIILTEAMLNICQHILAKHRRVAVTGYKDTFRKAGEYSIINKSLAERLMSLASLRNEFLTHGYWKCDDRKLFSLVSENIGDIKAFVKDIKDYIKEA
ncbi:MAG: DUF86 domain-containing protein [Nitrospirae bacterium]|nr:DUF86 domain-containing protein [Nitrospirota bacterium]